MCGCLKVSRCRRTHLTRGCLSSVTTLSALFALAAPVVVVKVRGLITTGSKLVVTTLLFVLLLFISESRAVTTAICAIFSLVGALASALSGRGATAEKGEGPKEVEESLLLTPRR